MRSTILFVLLNIVCVLSIVPPSKIAKLGDAPYIVFIGDAVLYCGGVLIKKDIVLTAGHCINHLINQESYNVSILAGTLSEWSEENLQLRNAKKILLHEGYGDGVNDVQAFNDVGLIQLDDAFELNESVAPIDWITNSSAIDYNKTATVYGYGYTRFGSTTGSTPLNVKNVSLIRDDVCETLINQAVTKSEKQKYELCTSVGPCSGDSGSPLVQNIDGITKLIGIFSWGADDNISCDKGPAVYESSSYFSEWILKGIDKLTKKTLI